MLGGRYMPLVLPHPISLALLECLALLIPTILISVKKRRNILVTWSLLPVSYRAIFAGFLYGVACFLILFFWVAPVCEWLIPISLPEKQQLTQLLLPVPLRPLWVDIACFALIPACCEEVLFRGALFPSFLGTSLQNAPAFSKRVLAAMLSTALLFAAFHLSLSRFLPMLFLGLGLGFAAWRSQSLWASVLMHTTNNAIVIILARQHIESDTFSGWQKGLLTSLALALFVAATCLRKKEFLK